MPIDKRVCIPNYLIQESDIINNTFCYKYSNTNIEFEITPNAIGTRVNVEFTIHRPDSETNMYDEFVKLLIHSNVTYDIIKTPFDTNKELFEYIYLSDIYIPLSYNFNQFSLIAQKLQTYCLFVNKSPMSTEYCLYGDVPILKSNDLFYHIEQNRIDTVLRVDDVKESIEKYYENKENPFFIYNKEITKLLF